MQRIRLLAARTLWTRRARVRHRLWQYWSSQKPVTSSTQAKREQWWRSYQQAESQLRIINGELARLGATSISASGLKLIMGFEGFRARPYQDAGGVWTRGYGETEGITALSPAITEHEGEANLRHLIDTQYAPHILALKLRLNQNQFDAVCSFIYNLGVGMLEPSHTFGRLLRAGKWKQAADSMLLYDHDAGRVLAGLEHRRRVERALFLAPVARAPKVKPKEATPKKPATVPPRQRALEWAVSKVGIHEEPPGSNRGPQIDQWQRRFGFLAAPWCGIFCGNALLKAGVRGVTARIASVGAIQEDAEHHRGCFTGYTPHSAHGARPGDLVILFGFGIHVELVHSVNPDGSVQTIGGNTTPAPGSGKEFDGGCVAARHRAPSEIHGVAHVRYDG